jgi:hypothetical protein
MAHIFSSHPQYQFRGRPQKSFRVVRIVFESFRIVVASCKSNRSEHRPFFLERNHINSRLGRDWPALSPTTSIYMHHPSRLRRLQTMHARTWSIAAAFPKAFLDCRIGHGVVKNGSSILVVAVASNTKRHVLPSSRSHVGGHAVPPQR